MSSRGQSEVIGVVLLVGVTVVAATAAGTLVLDTAVPRTDAPTADVSATVTTTAVELLHDGGEGLAGGDLRVRVAVAGAETNATWAGGVLSGSDDRFEPGDRWRANWTWVDASPSTGDDVTVLLVHDSTNTVLVRARLRPRSVAPAAAKIGPRGAASPPGAPSLSVSLSTTTANDPDVVTDGDDVDVTVEAYDADGSVTGVTVNSSRFGGSNRSFGGNATATTTVDAAAGAGEGFHRATATATDDEGLTTSGRTRAIEVDATAPTVTAFDARDAGGRLNVSFESTERLRTGSWDGVRVDVSGPTTTTLVGADFTVRSAPSGGLVYAANRSVSDGDYTVDLVDAEDAAGNDGGGARDTVRVGPPAPGDSTPPSVTVRSPDGGETLRGGERTTVRWSASDGDSGVSSVDVDYSPDGGSTWRSVAADTANDGQYSWRVPEVDTSSALVRVRATDGAGNTGGDESDATFTVDSTAPSVTDVTVTGTDPAIEDDDVGTAQTVTVTFDEAMDTSAAPTVEVLDLASSPYAVSADGGTNGWQDARTWRGTVTFRDDDEDRTGAVRVGAASDVAGNARPGGRTSVGDGTFPVRTAPSRVQDPGSAYEDVDGDGYYEPGDGDVKVDVSDGTYDAASNGNSLVIPASVGSIDASSVSLKGENVTVDVDVTSSGAATLSATTGTLRVEGQTVRSTGGGQALSLSGATVRGNGSTVRSAGSLSVSASTRAYLADATVDSDGGGQELKATGGGLVAPRAVVESAGSVTLTPSGPVDLSAATVRSTGSGQALKLTGTTVTADAATVESQGSVTVKASAGGLSLADATVDNTGGSNQDVSLTTNADVDLSGATLRGDRYSTFTASRQNNGNTAFVDGAVFERGDGTAKELDVSPGSRRGGGRKSPQNVEGTPAKGRVV